MIISHQFSKQQARDLKILNQQLNEDAIIRTKAEKELAAHREHLEELVNERTIELEEMNIILKEKNEELKKYNELFIGREFRIKELRDKIKEYKSKYGII